MFAACSRVQFAGGARPWGRELAAVLSFEAIIVWPVSLYFFWVYPDWSWMYFVDPRRLPHGVSLLVMMAFGMVLLGGYLTGWALLRTGRERWLHGAVALVAVGLIAFAAVCRKRLLHGGTFDEFHRSHSLSVGAGKLSGAIVITLLGVGGAAAFVGFTLYEQGKRFRA